MKDTFYFSHDYNARHDPKLVTLQMEYGLAGIGLFWCIVEMLYEQGGYLRTECERIAFELRADANAVQWIINESGLFKISEENSDFFYSETVISRLEKRGEKTVKARESAVIRWNKERERANAMRSHSEGNAIKERKVKESKVNESKEKKEIAETISPPYQSENFILLWNEFLKMPKQKKKPLTAISLMAKKLKNYNEAFAIHLLENAIAGNYQGLVFADTDQKFENFKNGTQKNIRGITGQTLRGVEFGEF